MSEARSEPPRQLPLDLGHAAGSAREDLVVSAANREAVALVERWPDWPAPVVVLAGPPGSGKSHLAAIWRQAAGAVALEAGGAQAMPEGAAALLVEDADRPGLDETALFHRINAIRARGGHLLLTARRFPAAWPVTLPDLRSRLKAATVVEIREPDDLLLSGVIVKLFADRQVEVDPHVVRFLVRRIERSLSSAMRVVEALDRAALERQTRISRGLAAEIVGQADRRPPERTPAPG
jgi:chromosomal replication initiation ATPase DnaA